MAHTYSPQRMTEKTGIINRENATHRGTNLRTIASWGKGKSMYSIIFNTASDLMYDLESRNKS